MFSAWSGGDPPDAPRKQVAAEIAMRLRVLKR
jgi:hypothetical protein